MKIDRSSQHEGSANQKYGIWLTSSLLWVRSIRVQGLGLHTLVGVPEMPSRGVAGWVVVTREPLSFFVRFVECHKLQFIEGVCALKEFVEARVLANNLWPRVVLTCENRRYAQSGTLTAQRHPQPRVSSLCHATRALEEARTHTHTEIVS